MKKQVRVLGIPIYEVHQERSIDLGSLSDPGQKWAEVMGGKIIDAGVPVNTTNVLTITAVWRAVNIIAGSIASLPRHAYQKLDDGSRREATKHPVSKLFRSPSKLMTGYTLEETMVASLLLWGNSYAVIRKNPATADPVELIPVHPSSVLVTKYDGQIYYQVRVDGEVLSLAAGDMIHYAGLSFDGLQGYPPISVMRDSMGLSIAAQKFGARFFGSGANMDGVIEVPGTLGDAQFDRLRNSWNERYKGIEKSHNTAILEGGSKYQRIGIPPEDAQFLQTRQFQVAEVARMFGVQPHLLMDLDRATNNNIEHQGMEFVTFTLTPWVKRLEAELNRKLFSEEEKGKYYTEYNLTGLLRGDSKTRAEYYKSMFSIGAMSPNRIRQLENEPAYEGGDQHFAQAGYMPITSLQEYHNSKNKNNGKKK